MRLGGSLGSQGLDMSKPLSNGSGPGVVDATDEDAATMVAAIQDHIASCGKNLQETHHFAAMGIKEERFPCDFDHMYASMAEHDSAAAAEVRQLKELLLLHLDLIQQQSEQLVNKDKQLNNLRHENDMLRQRLERMDRRVTLNHNKRQPSDASANPNDPTSGSGAPDAPATVEQQGAPNMQPFPKIESSSSPRRSPLTVGTKHLTLPERSCRSRKSSWSSDTANSRRSAGSDRGRDSAGSRNRNDSPSIAAKRSRVTQSRRETNNTDEPEPTRQKLTVPVVPLNTPVLFYVPGVHDGLAGRGKSNEEPSQQSLLEVPSWRIKPCTSCYSMEGTENLEDEVFLKRHQRLELDERRRKRWDIQRLREQRQYEKLRLRQSQTKPGIGGGASAGRRSVLASRRRNQQQEPVQLWPDPEEVQFIEVDNFLPVTAFGVPVPAFAPMVFELPWVVDRETILEEDEKEMEEDQQVDSIKQEPATAPSSPALPPPPPPPPPPPASQPTTRSHPGATRTQPGRRSRGASATTTRTRTSTRRR